MASSSWNQSHLITSPPTIINHRQNMYCKPVTTKNKSACYFLNVNKYLKADISDKHNSLYGTLWEFSHTLEGPRLWFRVACCCCWTLLPRPLLLPGILLPSFYQRQHYTLPNLLPASLTNVLGGFLSLRVFLSGHPISLADPDDGRM